MEAGDLHSGQSWAIALLGRPSSHVQLLPPIGILWAGRMREPGAEMRDERFEVESRGREEEVHSFERASSSRGGKADEKGPG